MTPIVTDDLETHLQRIEKEGAPLGAITAALEIARGNADKFMRVRASVRVWLQNRLSSLLASISTEGVDPSTREVFQNASDRWQESLDALDRGEDAFIPNHGNAIEGITIPASVGDNTETFVCAAHIRNEQ